MNYKLDSENCFVHQRTQHKTAADWQNAVVCKANDFAHHRQVSFIGDLMYDGQILFSEDDNNSERWWLWVLTPSGTHLHKHLGRELLTQMLGYFKDHEFKAYLLNPAKRCIFDICTDFTSLEKATAAIDEITALI